jgi:D-amino-acid dehydrogenase
MSHKIIVIGGGVVGALSAYYLAQGGHEVTLLERNPELGLEASAANANQLSYSYVFPPVAPFIVSKIPGIVLGRDPALKIRALADPQFWLWAVRALPYLLSPERSRRTSDSIRAINEESRSLMAGFVARHTVSFSHSKAGRIVIYDKAEDLRQSLAAFQECGLSSYIHALSYEETLAREPGLKNRKPFAGALCTPDDETGDCEAFTKALAGILQEMGVRVRTGTAVKRLIRRSDRIEGIELENGEVLEAGRIVLTAGVWARKLLRSAGLNAPIYPVKGYTYELPARAKRPFPFKASIVDTGLKMVFTPLENSLKVSNGMFFTPLDRPHDERFLAHVQRAAAGIYPDIDFGEAVLRSGYRPWTPNSLPIIGKRLDNLYLNIGHGMLGWTMAHGTAKRLADLVGRETR